MRVKSCSNSRQCAAALPEIGKRVRRWLAADWEPTSAMAALGQDAALIARGGGRMLRCSSFYEDFVKTVLTINTSWSSTCRMAAALVAEPGKGAFPGPEAVLDYGEERLRDRAKLGFRAATLVAATRRLLADGAIDRAGDGAPERLGHDPRCDVPAARHFGSYRLRQSSRRPPPSQAGLSHEKAKPVRP